MALTAKLYSLGDATSERGVTAETAIQSPAVFNFLAVIDGKSLPYMISENVGCNWNYGDSNAKNVMFGPRAGQSTNTMFGSAMSAKVLRVPIGGGVQSFTVRVVVKDKATGDQVEVRKTVYVKAADHGKTSVVAYSPTLNTANPAEWVGVPAGATLINGVPGYEDFTDKLVMFSGGETFAGNNEGGTVLQIKINQTNCAVTSFGTGRAILPVIMIGSRDSFNGLYESQTLRDSDITGATIADVNISAVRAPRVRCPMIYDDLTIVDIDSDYYNEEIVSAGSLDCLAAWSTPYTSTSLTVENVKFPQKLFVAESVFKGSSVPELAYNGSESRNIWDYNDITGRTVSTFTVSGDVTVYNAGQTATIANVGTLTINSDGSYVFTAVSGWASSTNTATVLVTDNTAAVTKYFLGQLRSNVSVAGINSTIMNMVLLDVQAGSGREHNFRQMGNQLALAQDLHGIGGQSDNDKACFTWRGCEYASPTDLPAGTDVTFGTSTITWWGGHPRSIDASGYRVLPGMKYIVRQHCKGYVDSSVDASIPFIYASVVGSTNGQGNTETGVKYTLDYNIVPDYEDAASTTVEFLATRVNDTIDDIDHNAIVKVSTNRTLGPEAFYSDSTTSFIDFVGDLPLASLPGQLLNRFASARLAVQPAVQDSVQNFNG